MCADFDKPHIGEVGDVFGAYDLLEYSVDQGVRWRIQLQLFEFRVLPHRLLVEHFVDEGSGPLGRITQSQNDQGQLPLASVIKTHQEVIQGCIEVSDKLGACRRHHLETLRQAVYEGY